jgi:carbonic anhydrase/acetyltransferase-like protein (isoleucine patch superfamily)
VQDNATSTSSAEVRDDARRRRHRRHNAVVHGCTIEDGVLVGMGPSCSTAVVGAESLIAAGALLPPGMRVPPRSLVLGSPGKVVRLVSDDELERIRSSASNYVGYAKRYRAEGVR